MSETVSARKINTGNVAVDKQLRQSPQFKNKPLLQLDNIQSSLRIYASHYAFHSAHTFAAGHKHRLSVIVILFGKHNNLTLPHFLHQLLSFVT